MKIRQMLLFLGCAMTAGAQGTAREPYTLVPPRAKADSGFTLWLLSEDFACNALFSHVNISVGTAPGDTGRIDVSFLAREDSSIRCAATPGAVYGPKFPVPALKPTASNRYAVYATSKLPCQVVPPLCGGVPDRPEFAGYLILVKGGTGWFIKPRRVWENSVFNLQLLNEKYGDCNWSFTHDSLTLLGKTLVLSFLPVYDPQRLCLVDNHPFGPAYPAKNLAVGVYPVVARERLACEFQDPPCIPPPALNVVDTLTVLTPPLPIHSKRAHGVRKPGILDPAPVVRGYRVNGQKPKLRIEPGKQIP